MPGPDPTAFAWIGIIGMVLFILVFLSTFSSSSTKHQSMLRTRSSGRRRKGRVKLQDANLKENDPALRYIEQPWFAQDDASGRQDAAGRRNRKHKQQEARSRAARRFRRAGIVLAETDPGDFPKDLNAPDVNLSDIYDPDR